MKKLQPYGLLNNVYSGFVLGKIEPMEDFDGSVALYREIYESILTDISAKIWPAWNYAKGAWKGPAKKFAEEATDLEIELMIEHFQRPNILDNYPKVSGNVDSQDIRSHLWHYRVEDDISLADTRFGQLVLNKAGANYYLYNSRINPNTFPSWFAGDVRPKIHGLFDFKPFFQRPRPNQAALLLGHQDFTWQIGAAGKHTGLHPSLMSGHCVQGILYGCKAMEAWYASGAEPTREDIEMLAKFSADFGDRRVFAGVHYPTDNIASWIIALRLIPYLYKPMPQILRFALEAITKQSTVYKLIQDQFPAHTALQQSLAVLNQTVDDANGLLP